MTNWPSFAIAYIAVLVTLIFLVEFGVIDAAGR